jgi:hypothetical protein
VKELPRLKIRRERKGLPSLENLNITIDDKRIEEIIPAIHKVQLDLAVNKVNQMTISFYVGDVDIDAEVVSELRALQKGEPTKFQYEVK